MSDDFVIGSTPIPEINNCSLKFHQYTIYDSVNWTQSGVLRWNATLKCFEVLPDPVPPQNENIEILAPQPFSVLQGKTEANVNSKKIVIPKKNK